MANVLAYALVIALILPLSMLLAGAEQGRARSTYRAPAAVALALGLLFFALGFVQPSDAPGAWVFRAFYGTLCCITLAAANFLVCLEESHA